MTMQKLKEIKVALNTKFKEREAHIDALLTAIIARQHVLFIGSAGTAKSALSSELAKIIDGTEYFQWLLGRFTTPEELFGALSLKDLEQGIYKRNTTNKLPNAHLAFLDEIFKSNSAILNSLLTLINERIYYNNGGIVNVPLMSIVGSSNEYPEQNEGLEALFDRFLLRLEVEYIKEDANFADMLLGVGSNVQMPRLTLGELQSLQFSADMVQIPQDVINQLIDIRNELAKEAIYPSDRRFKQSLSILRAKALLEQRQVVQKGDLVILKDCLWDIPENREMTIKIVKSLAQDNVHRYIDAWNEDIKQIYNNFVQQRDNGDDITNIAIEANKKLKTIDNEITQLKANEPSRANEMDIVQQLVKEKLTEITNIMLSV